MCQLLDRVFAERALPEGSILGMGNGPQFAGHALDAWAF